MKKLAVVGALLAIFGGCTVNVKPSPPPKPCCKRVWVPGHYNCRGVWVPGHWRWRCP